MSDNAAAGRVDRSFRTQCGRCGGTGRRADLRGGGARERGAQRDLLPLFRAGTLRDGMLGRRSRIACFNART